jgi:peptide/nickel transport system permease protein
VGLDIRPVLKEVPGTSHYYAELPDADLVAAGLTPHTEGGAR